MNAKRGPSKTRMIAGAGAPWLALAILISIFLPLPFIVLPFLLTVSFFVLCRASPLGDPVLPSLSPAPAAPRSPPL